MFNFPSLKPKNIIPSNKYAYNRKQRQQQAIEREALKNQPNKTPCILDLSINELEQLLKGL